MSLRYGLLNNETEDKFTLPSKSFKPYKQWQPGQKEDDDDEVAY